MAIPATLQDSLMARLDRLGTAKHVAQLGAIVGREFPAALLQTVAPLDAAMLQKALAQLVDAELLQQRGLPPQARYRFKHALIQEAAYTSLLPSTRRQYHSRIARILETQFINTPEAQPELLAHHYTQAGLRGEAIAYWQQAGQGALARSAHLEAMRHCTIGLEMLTALPETAERTQQELGLLLVLGMAMIATRGYAASEVGQIYNRARVLCRQEAQTTQHFPVLVGLWNFYLTRAELQTAHRLGQQCWHVAQQAQDATLCLEAHGLLGLTLFFLGEFTQAQCHLEQCLALHDSVQPGPSARHTVGLPAVVCPSFVAFILWLRGYPAQAQHQSHAALARARQIAHPYSLAYALNLAGWLQQLLAGGQIVQDMAQSLSTLAAEHGFPFWEAQGAMLLGRTLCQQGQADAGLTAMRQGLSAYQATGAVLLRPFFLAHLAEASMQAGDYAAGLTALTDALSLVEKTGERWWVAELYRLRGELLLAQRGKGQKARGKRPQWQEAEASLCQALEVTRHQKARALELRAATSLSRLWRQRGKHAAARQVLADVYGSFGEGFDAIDLQVAQVQLDELR
jgi:predicted ATPase